MTGVRLESNLAGRAQSFVVGRDEELARVGEMARRLATGRGGVVVLLGETGLGRTTLLEAVVARATALVENVRVVHVPGGTIRHNAIATIASIVAASVPLPASPATRLVEKVAKDGTVVAPEDPDVMRAAMEIARAVSGRRPLLVTVDNVPLSTAGVFPVFTMVAAASASMPFLVVVTSASVPPGTQELSSIGNLWIHRLQPLGPHDAVQVIRRGAGGIHIPRHVAAVVAELTEGNPGDMLEVCSLLSEDQLAGLEPLPDPLPGTSVSTTIYRDWFAALPEPHRMAVLGAAAFGPRTVTEIEEATGVAVGDVRGRDGRGLLRQENGRVIFTDRRAPSAVLAFTTRQELLAARGRLAKLLVEGSLEENVTRLRAGLPVDDDALPGLIDLARSYLARAGFAQAGALAEAVGNLAPPGALRSRAAWTGGLAGYHEGHLGRAVRLLGEAVAGATDPDERYACLVPLLLAMAARDRYVPAEVADAAIADFLAERPDLAASVAALVARKSAIYLEQDLAREYAHRAEEILETAADVPPARLRALRDELDLSRSLAAGRYTPGAPGASTSLSELLTGQPPEDVLSWELLTSRMFLQLRARDWGRARSTLTALRNRLTRFPSPLWAAQAAVLGMSLQLSTWQVPAALKILEDAEDRLPLELPFGGIGLCEVARARVLEGRPADATEWLERAQQLSSGHPAPRILQVMLARELGLVALAKGQLAAAAKHYGEAVSTGDGVADTVPHLSLGALLCAAMAGDSATSSTLAGHLLTKPGHAAPEHAETAVTTALSALVTAPAADVVARVVEVVGAARRLQVQGLRGTVLYTAERALERVTREEHAAQVAALGNANGAVVTADRDEHRTQLLAEALADLQACGAVAFAPARRGAARDAGRCDGELRDRRAGRAGGADRPGAAHRHDGGQRRLEQADREHALRLGPHGRAPAHEHLPQARHQVPARAARAHPGRVSGQ